MGPAFPRAAPVVGRPKAKIEQDIQAALSRYLEHQSHRQSLPPLPEFPSESELHQAHQQWLTNRTDWSLVVAEPLLAARVNPGDIELMTLPPLPEDD
jgi:hypothetical protein